VEAVAFYDKPYIKFERLLETYHSFAPRGLSSFLSAMPVWIKEKLFMKKMLHDELAGIGPGSPPLLFPEHHLSHAASAYYPSPFNDAAILTVDGVGEWATTTIAAGKDAAITILKELHFPHSLGLLYSAFTYYCGFRVNSGEYKLMGLAPYGVPDAEETHAMKRAILDFLVDVRSDGSLLLNMDYFDFATGLRMVRESAWKKIFGMPVRSPEAEISQSYMNLAYAIQEVTEEVMLKLATTARDLTGSRNLVMAGGVALNCVANGKILRTGLFDDIWIQPAAGDAGGAVGAALAAWHIWKGKQRVVDTTKDGMLGTYLGPEFSGRDVRNMAAKHSARYTCYDDFDQLCGDVSALIAQGNVVGWFQGRMEFGPRALGNRSILGDARNPEMQKRLNLTIKFRESFRPFAPSVLEEDCRDFFELDRSSPYMLFVAPVQKQRRNLLPANYRSTTLNERLYFLRTDVPAITHIDMTARIQTVSKTANLRYWQLINAFKQRTGYGLIVNTSFNVRGEPIVCTPADAYRCFMRTDMEYLVIGESLFDKREQPAWKESHAVNHALIPD
jgi:carbamoyltransferase